MPFVQAIFRSFFQAGFECSSYKCGNGKRLDLLAATGHDEPGRKDHQRIPGLGIRTARLAARRHLIEQAPSQYNFDSLAITLDAAAESGAEVLLDLLHFGWPDHPDVAEAILNQQSRLNRSNYFYEPRHHRPDLFLSPALGIRFSTPSTPDEPLRPA